MNCSPTPEETCGSLINDTCVVVTASVPQCLRIQGATCYRQSEVNTQVFTKVCAIDAAVTAIQSSIDLSDLTGCDAITPVKDTVKEEFQNVYNILCDLKTDLSLPLDGQLDLKCLVDPCGNPISTLGQLLQALIDQHCECCDPSGV